MPCLLPGRGKVAHRGAYGLVREPELEEREEDGAEVGPRFNWTILLIKKFSSITSFLFSFYSHLFICVDFYCTESLEGLGVPKPWQESCL